MIVAQDKYKKNGLLAFCQKMYSNHGRTNFLRQAKFRGQINGDGFRAVGSIQNLKDFMGSLAAPNSMSAFC